MTENISILIANFNNSRYINECITSVLNQTSGNWEISFLDDLSTDNSLDVIKSFCNNKIDIYEANENRGYAEALKDLVDLSTNDIVGILDSDDALMPDAVETILRYYEDNPEHQA